MIADVTWNPIEFDVLPGMFNPLKTKSSASTSLGSLHILPFTCTAKFQIDNIYTVLKYFYVISLILPILIIGCLAGYSSVFAIKGHTKRL